MMSTIEHFLVTFFLGGGGQRHLSGNNEALRWSILSEKQAHNELKPIVSLKHFCCI